MSYDESKEDTSVGGGRVSKAGLGDISIDNENFCSGSVQSMSDNENHNGSRSSPLVIV